MTTQARLTLLAATADAVEAAANNLLVANAALDAAQANQATAAAALVSAQASYDDAEATIPDDNPAPPEIWLDDGQVYCTPAPEGYELETLIPDHTQAGGWQNGFGGNPTANQGGTYRARFVQKAPQGHYIYEGAFSEASF